MIKKACIFFGKNELAGYLLTKTVVADMARILYKISSQPFLKNGFRERGKMDYKTMPVEFRLRKVNYVLTTWYRIWHCRFAIIYVRRRE